MTEFLRRPLEAPLGALAAARGRLFVWVPVCMSFGIGGYFSLRSEPGPIVYLAASLGLLALLGLAGFGAERWRLPALGAALVVLGGLLAGARTHVVAAPVLEFRYYGAVEGRVIAIDRSFSDQPRILLDQVVMERMSAGRTPERVRIALHGEQGFVTLEPGLRVILTAHVSPPDGPVEPGGFDFQRLAWYSRLGGVGYTRAPVLALEPAEAGAAGLFIHRVRDRISTAVRARLPGEVGGFAAALTTGDRSGLSRDTTEDLRASNLSHLLAISGLHMGMLTAFVFAALRYGFALIPPIALRLPVKKLAAFLALWVAAGYLALSGGNIATQRAFIMVAVMLVAILCDRRALTLRSVAMAAVIILVLEPESLTEPGFQMSFAATTALVGCFALLGRWQRRVPGVLVPVLTLLLSSAIAGLATAPVAAAHFNRIAEYGLLANLLSVPLMGVLVMPMAVLAAVLAPIGAEMVALTVMAFGLRWILGVAHWVAGLNGAVIPVPTPPDAVLPVLALGVLAVLLVRSLAGRLAGVALVLGAGALWMTVERPAALISGDGALVGVMTESGRALSKPKGAGFVAQSWLENDGDLAVQEAAFGRPGLSGETGSVTAKIGDVTLAHFTGKSAPDRAGAACLPGALVIMGAEWTGTEAPECEVFDIRRLRDTGALAIYDTAKGLHIVSSRDRSGARLWNSRTLRREWSRKPTLRNFLGQIGVTDTDAAPDTGPPITKPRPAQ